MGKGKGKGDEWKGDGKGSGWSDFKGKGKGPAASGPTVTETMEVDQRDVGKIIGTGGSNIRELQRGAGCRIDIPRNRSGEEDESENQTVTLRGSAEQIKLCKECIEGVLVGSEVGDVLAELEGGVIVRGIDPTSMGILSQQVTDLEKSNNVKIDLGARSARIIPRNHDRDQAVRVKETIEDLLADVTSVTTETVRVPGHQVQEVLNDTALRQLQDQSGITLNLFKDDEGTGIRITGLAGVVEQAKSLCQAAVGGVGADFVSLAPDLLRNIPPGKWNELNNDLHHLKGMADCQIELTQGSNAARLVGEPENVQWAKGEIMNILMHHFPNQCATVELPARAVDFVAGPEDRELMRLQLRGTVVTLDRKDAFLWICGDARGLEQVRGRVRNLLKRWENETAEIQMPNKNACWAVLGKGGDVVRKLQADTSARIDVDLQQQVVRIAGAEEAVKKAKARVLQISGGRDERYNDGGNGFERASRTEYAPPTHETYAPPPPKPSPEEPSDAPAAPALLVAQAKARGRKKW